MKPILPSGGRWASTVNGLITTTSGFPVGETKIGTLLVQDRQDAAIGLPMKVLAWEDERGRVKIAHNTVQWLQQRHGLTDEATLRTIDEVLARVVASARTQGSG